MCRFVLYLGSEISVSSLVTEPENSIIHQSFHSHEREEPLNGDGFGIAWYAQSVSPEPAIFKDVTPAWNNPNLLNLARVTRSGCVLAHVRAASPGSPVTQTNCHPFGSGPLAFMHNGAIGGFKGLRRALLRQLSDEAFNSITGSTDSEHLFALFIDKYREISKNPGDASERLATALKATAGALEDLIDEAGIKKASTLNMAVTDGRNAVVSRYVTGRQERAISLYVHSGGSLECRCGRYAMRAAAGGTKAVLVASEPLSGDDDWREVPPGSLLIVDKELTVEIRPM